MYENKYPYSVKAPGVVATEPVNTVVYAVDKYHAVELAWSRNLDKQPNRHVYIARRKR